MAMNLSSPPKKRINVALYLALMAPLGGLYLFIKIGDAVRDGETQPFDEWVLRSLRDAQDPATPIGPAWLRECALDTTALGSLFVLTLVVGSVVGFLLLQGRRRMAWLTVFSTATGATLTGLLKYFMGRQRPDIVPHLREVSSSSFPSGHAAISAVVFLTLGMLLVEIIPSKLVRAYCLGWALLLTFLVGLSRVYLGVHYPSDVLGGWIVGLAWALGCWAVLWLWPSLRRAEQPPHS